MTDDKWRDDSGNDHPQTIDAEPLEETRSAELLEREREGKGSGDAASEAADEGGPNDAILSEADEEAIRSHAQGGRSMGDAIGANAGLDRGSGTPGDTGDLGGGDPQKVG